MAARKRPGRLRARYEALRAWVHDHDRLVGVLFFAGGVAWDATTVAQDVSRPLVLAQLVGWLVLLAVTLVLDIRLGRAIQDPSEPKERWRERIAWAGQFAQGAVLGALTMHFLHSSSWGPTLLFLVVLAGAQLANEFASHWLRPVWLRLALLVFGVHAFSLFALPVATGWLADRYGDGLNGWLRPFPSVWLGLAATVVAAGTGLGVAWLLDLGLDDRTRQGRRWRHALTIATPLVLVRGLDLAGLVPPVPLCALDVAMVQDITVRTGPDGSRDYILRRRQPWWALSPGHPSTLTLGPDDGLACYTPLFAPGGLEVDVAHVWERWSPEQGTWERRWRHEMQRSIRGGRERGFRTYSTLHHALRRADGTIDEGWWRCRVETATGREIGRRRVKIVVDPDPPPMVERVAGR